VSKFDYRGKEQIGNHEGQEHCAGIIDSIKGAMHCDKFELEQVLLIDEDRKKSIHDKVKNENREIDYSQHEDAVAYHRTQVLFGISDESGITLDPACPCFKIGGKPCIYKVLPNHK